MKALSRVLPIWISIVLCFVFQVYFALLLMTASASAEAEEEIPASPNVTAPSVPTLPAPTVPAPPPRREKKSFGFSWGNDADSEDKSLGAQEGTTGKKIVINKGGGNDWDDIIVPTVMFICIAVGFIAFYHYRHKSRVAQMETIRFMVEKGQPIPENIFTSTPKKTWIDQMQTGLTYAGLGAGVALFFFTVGGPWAIGMIFVFIGAGHLAAAYIKKQHNIK